MNLNEAIADSNDQRQRLVMSELEVKSLTQSLATQRGEIEKLQVEEIKYRQLCKDYSNLTVELDRLREGIRKVIEWLEPIQDVMGVKKSEEYMLKLQIEKLNNLLSPDTTPTIAKTDCSYCDNGNNFEAGMSGFCVHCHRTSLSLAKTPTLNTDKPHE